MPAWTIQTQIRMFLHELLRIIAANLLLFTVASISSILDEFVNTLSYRAKLRFVLLTAVNQVDLKKDIIVWYRMRCLKEGKG